MPTPKPAPKPDPLRDGKKPPLDPAKQTPPPRPKKKDS